MNRLAGYYKAIAGLIGPGVLTAIVALSDGHITNSEWGLIAAAAIGGGGLVAAAPKNKPKA